MNRINRNFDNRKLHQKVFIKMPCQYWGGLIPIDNFLGSGDQRNGKNTADLQHNVIFLSNFSTGRRATGR